MHEFEASGPKRHDICLKTTSVSLLSGSLSLAISLQFSCISRLCRLGGASLVAKSAQPSHAQSVGLN